MRVLAELRTLSRPPAAPAARALAIGDRAPRLGERPVEGPTLVVFVRHVGCPFAEATVGRLADVLQSTPSLGGWLVSHAPAEPTETWLQTIGRPPRAQLVCDPTYATHRLWGLGPSRCAHFLGLRSLRAVVALRRAGIVNRSPAGSRWQPAGAFAIDVEHRVAWVHVPEHAGALPDLRDAARAVVR